MISPGQCIRWIKTGSSRLCKKTEGLKPFRFERSEIVCGSGKLGYAIDNRSASQNRSEYDYVGNHHALTTGSDSGLGFSGGFKIGVLVNRKK
jgi:hypothetical protein